MAIRRRPREGAPSAPQQAPQGGGAQSRWHDRPDWITEGDYDETGAGIIARELAGQLAEDHRRRQGHQEDR
jgi:hypothetical protein